MTTILLTNAVTIAAAILLLWLLSLLLHDVSIVDIFWGLGFVLVAWLSFARAAERSRDLVLPVLTAVWGLRLSGYLFLRNHGKPEDNRYAEMRKKHGAKFPVVSLLTVFLLQGVIMWIVSLPLQLAQASAGENHRLLVAGTALWFVGLFFEAVGDWQLVRFKSDPANKGHVMVRGLWRYTRHPNYFGDFCVWWALYAVSLGCGGAWWTVVGPVLMTFLLLKFSGVALTEQSMSRKPGFHEYSERTNAFVPWFPRK